MITGVHTDTMVLESQKRPEAASMFTDQHAKGCRLVEVLGAFYKSKRDNLQIALIAQQFINCSRNARQAACS
jgi:hypothetical protein